MGSTGEQKQPGDRLGQRRHLSRCTGQGGHPGGSRVVGRRGRPHCPLPMGQPPGALGRRTVAPGNLDPNLETHGQGQLSRSKNPAVGGDLSPCVLLPVTWSPRRSPPPWPACPLGWGQRQRSKAGGPWPSVGTSGDIVVATKRLRTESWSGLRCVAAGTTSQGPGAGCRAVCPFIPASSCLGVAGPCTPPARLPPRAVPPLRAGAPSILLIDSQGKSRTSG